MKPYKLLFALLFSSIFFIACAEEETKDERNPYNLDIINQIDGYKQSVIDNPNNELIDLEVLMPNLILDIRYATKNNFCDEIIYQSPRAFLRKPAAEALLKIQDDLSLEGLCIKVFDAYRPYAATLRFYEVYPDTNFVAAPWNGSVHNRGAAVDLTLIDIVTGEELEMPTLFDDFSEKSGQNYNDLPEKILENRAKLRNIMEKHGFSIYDFEWWHYNFDGFADYKIMDIPFEELDK